MEPSKHDDCLKSPQSLSWIRRHQKNLLCIVGTSTNDRKLIVREFGLVSVYLLELNLYIYIQNSRVCLWLQ
jgi:hypothetical protein